MYNVGITGGIGSGKSFVCSLFEKLDIPVYYADLRARHLQNNDTQIITALTSLFGKDIYQNGELDRAALGSIIFNDKKLLSKVNQIVHPVISRDYATWSESQSSPFVLQEAAILFESGLSKEFDSIITVSAPVKLRTQRVISRDGSTEEQVAMRMKNQLSDKEREDRSDFILINDGISLVLPQIIEISSKLTYLSEKM